MRTTKRFKFLTCRLSSRYSSLDQELIQIYPQDYKVLMFHIKWQSSQRDLCEQVLQWMIWVMISKIIWHHSSHGNEKVRSKTKESKKIHTQFKRLAQAAMQLQPIIFMTKVPYQKILIYVSLQKIQTSLLIMEGVSPKEGFEHLQETTKEVLWRSAQIRAMMSKLRSVTKGASSRSSQEILRSSRQLEKCMIKTATSTVKVQK